MKAGTGGLAKTTRPSARGALRRTRLFRLLDQRRSRPIVWIAAPPGAGKTTLLASYVEARRTTALWYRADETDADLATFVYHAGRAAARLAPRRRSALPLLRPEYWLSLSRFSRRFFGALYERLRPPWLLALDNYQDVPEHARLHEVVADGLALLPPGGRAVILSRHDPPPAFARLRASGALRLVGADTLCLNEAESRAIARAQGLRLSRDTVCRLHERTRGWAAGLTLMLEQAPPGDASAAFPTDPAPQAVFDYLATESFQRADAQPIARSPRPFIGCGPCWASKAACDSRRGA